MVNCANLRIGIEGFQVIYRSIALCCTFCLLVFVKRYAKYYANATALQVAELAAVARTRVLMQKTMLIESETLKDWLEHIMNDVRPISENELNV